MESKNPIWEEVQRIPTNQLIVRFRETLTKLMKPRIPPLQTKEMEERYKLEAFLWFGGEALFERKVELPDTKEQALITILGEWKAPPKVNRKQLQAIFEAIVLIAENTWDIFEGLIPKARILLNQYEPNLPETLKSIFDQNKKLGVLILVLLEEMSLKVRKQTLDLIFEIIRCPEGKGQKWSKYNYNQVEMWWNLFANLPQEMIDKHLSRLEERLLDSLQTSLRYDLWWFYMQLIDESGRNKDYPNFVLRIMQKMEQIIKKTGKVEIEDDVLEILFKKLEKYSNLPSGFVAQLLVVQEEIERNSIPFEIIQLELDTYYDVLPEADTRRLTTKETVKYTNLVRWGYTTFNNDLNEIIYQNPKLKKAVEVERITKEKFQDRMWRPHWEYTQCLIIILNGTKKREHIQEINQKVPDNILRILIVYLDKKEKSGKETARRILTLQQGLKCKYVYECDKEDLSTLDEVIKKIYYELNPEDLFLVEVYKRYRGEQGEEMAEYVRCASCRERKYIYVPGGRTWNEERITLDGNTYESNMEGRIVRTEEKLRDKSYFFYRERYYRVDTHFEAWVCNECIYDVSRNGIILEYVDGYRRFKIQVHPSGLVSATPDNIHWGLLMNEGEGSWFLGWLIEHWIPQTGKPNRTIAWKWKILEFPLTPEMQEKQHLNHILAQFFTVTIEYDLKLMRIGKEDDIKITFLVKKDQEHIYQEIVNRMRNNSHDSIDVKSLAPIVCKRLSPLTSSERETQKQILDYLTKHDAYNKETFLLRTKEIMARKLDIPPKEMIKQLERLVKEYKITYEMPEYLWYYDYEKKANPTPIVYVLRSSLKEGSLRAYRQGELRDKLANNPDSYISKIVPDYDFAFIGYK